MKSSRQIVALFVAMSLLVEPAFAGPAAETRSYVESTQQGARDKARMIFHEYLQQSGIQASRISSFSDSFNQMAENLGTQIGELEKSRLKLTQALERADVPLDVGNVEQLAGQIEVIYQTTTDLYVAARAAEKRRDYLILKNGQQAAEISAGFQDFLNNIQITCANGIAANFEYPSLPPIRPIVPTYSFGVQATVDENGKTSISPQMPDVQTKGLNGDQAKIVYTSAYAGGWILGAYLVTGKIILTSTAAAGMSSSAALAATGVGLAAAAVVAVVCYFDGLLSAIEDSREVSDAMWIVHNDKADAETVRAEFKSICQPFAARAAKIKDRMQAINNNDPQAIAMLTAERETVRFEQTKIATLQRAADDEMIGIKKEMDTDPNLLMLDEEQRAKIAMERLGKTSSYGNLQAYIKNSKSDLLMNMFEVALIDIGLHIEAVDEAMQTQYKDLFKNQTNQHLNKIINLAMLGRRMSVPQKVKDLVQAEVLANTQIAGLFREFDAVFAGYVQSELTLGQDNSYKHRLIEWMAHVKAAQKILPSSPTLKVLATRGQAFLQFLGVTS